VGVVVVVVHGRGRIDEFADAASVDLIDLRGLGSRLRNVCWRAKITDRPLVAAVQSGGGRERDGVDAGHLRLSGMDVVPRSANEVR
jgi:hypothetical protein